jgi:hypothetical protein
MNFPPINEHCLISAMRILYQGIVLKSCMLHASCNLHNSWRGLIGTTNFYHHKSTTDCKTNTHFCQHHHASSLGYRKFAIIMLHAQATPADFGTTPPNLTGKNQGKDPPSTQPY